MIRNDRCGSLPRLEETRRSGFKSLRPHVPTPWEWHDALLTVADSEAHAAGPARLTGHPARNPKTINHDPSGMGGWLRTKVPRCCPRA